MEAYVVHPIQFPQGYPQIAVESNFRWLLQLFQPEFGFAILQELLFFCPEFRRVNNKAGIPRPGLVFHVKHLVIQHVLADIRRDFQRVEDAADEDRVVSCIKAAEYVARFFRGPGEAGLGNAPGEIASIQSVEQRFQIYIAALKAADARRTAPAAAGGACASLNVVFQDECPISLMMRVIDFLAVQLGKQDQGQRMIDSRRRVREDIADANSEPVFPQPGGVIQTGEREELDRYVGDSGFRPNLPVCRRKDFFKRSVSATARNLKRRHGLRFFSVFGTIFRASFASFCAWFALSIASCNALRSPEFFGMYF